MTEQEIERHKALIDQMGQQEMARLWRFAPVGHLYFTPPLSDYFEKRFTGLGSFTSEISKRIGL